MKNCFYALLIVILSISVWSCSQTAQNEKTVGISNTEKSTSNQKQDTADEQKTNLANVIESVNQKTPKQNEESQTLTSQKSDKSADDKFERRCGWFHNPTPANASLIDRDGEWLIGVQGGYQAEGNYPDFKSEEWVETNVHYGYGCACMEVKVNYKTREIIEIKSSISRPLSVCRKDKYLEKPE